MNEATNVEVMVHGQSLSIPRERVYFAFGSGRLTYDCIACGAKCCRGHGYVAQAGQELLVQLQARPALGFFVDRPSAAVAEIKNLAPGCFFLTGEGLCSVQLRHGHGAKPETCRLFPFNRFILVDEHLVVTPHPGLCPLGVVPSTGRAAESAHTRLLAEMAAAGVSASLRMGVYPDDTARLLNLERAVRQSCENALERWKPAFLLDEISAHAALAEDRPESAVDRRALGSLLDSMTRAVGLTSSDVLKGDEEVSRTVVALTPFIRARLLFQAPDAETTAARPTLSPDKLPTACLAMHVMAHLAHRAGTAPVTFQTISSLLDRYLPVVLTLAHFDSNVMWRRDTMIDLSVGAARLDHYRAYVSLARLLLPSRQRVAPQSLGSLIEAVNAWDEVERTTFLKLVSARMHRRFTSADEPSRLDERKRLPRPAAQQWLLGMLPEDFIQRFSEIVGGERAKSRRGVTSRAMSGLGKRIT